MRKTLLGLAAAATIATLAAPATAAPATGSTGPWFGTLAQGQTATHTYDNNPNGNDCIQLAVPYEVSVRWTPGDTVTLSTAGKSVTESDGDATIYVVRGWCTWLDASVTAVSGDTVYVLTITRQLLPPIVAS